MNKSQLALKLSFVCQARFSETKFAPPNGIDRFTFFYCWECSPWGLDDEPPGQWVVRSAKSLPDWESIDVYCPEASALSAELNDDEPWEPYTELLQKITGRDDYATMIGGYPRWVQSDSSCSATNSAATVAWHE
jgi:hypothetical protein